MAKPYLSVIIPSYNEAANLSRGVLDEVLKYLKTVPYDWEIILSDDGSKDSTLQQLDAFAKLHPNITVLHNEHAGKGPTVQSGMLAAKGAWRLFTDFDQSTPLKEVEKLLPYAREDYQVVIGSREVQGALRDKEPWYRHIMGKGFNFLVQNLALPGIFDTQCGFKLFSDTATSRLFPAMKVYGRRNTRVDAFTGAFDVELLYLARKNHYKIAEVPIEWHHHHTNRVSPVKDSLRMLVDILKVRIADLQGQYQRD